jgi:predicted AAA+ superfamily ATPase
MYPQVLSYTDAIGKKEKLQDIVSGQLYRDILEFQDIKNPDILIKLLELLAIRIGSEVSYHALAQLLGVSQQTVERYIDLLEKSFVIFRLRPYMTNKSKEVTKMKKIYFYDLGIRNTLLRAFQPISLRTDVGALWENYYILERRKNIEYSRTGVVQHFWRTKSQEEIDYLEVSDHIISGYECKWQEQKYIPPKAFT